MTPLITVEEMDRAVDKAATLPSPGPHADIARVLGAFSAPG
jgi:hypothetical protein